MKAFLQKVLYFFGVGKHDFIMSYIPNPATSGKIESVKFRCRKCGDVLVLARENGFLDENMYRGCKGRK